MSKNKAPKNASKISKLTETTKRKNKKAVKSVMGSSAVNEGETPEDCIVQFAGSQNLGKTHEAITRNKIVSKMFLDNVEKNPRVPIPVQDSERVKLDRDEVFFSGQCIKYDSIEYTIVQAPTKQNEKELWRYVWISQVPVIACLCHEDQMSTKGDDKKCYQYFPTEEKKTHVVEYGTGKMIIYCTKKENLSCGASKYSLEMTAQGIDAEEKVSDAPVSEKKSKNARQITLIHVTSWTGKQEKDPFESAHDVALAANEIVKMEVFHIGKNLNSNTVSPAVIQSFDGTARAGIMWVSLYLCRESNKKECFDFILHVKKIMKSRPGCFQTYFEFCYAAAVALWIAKDLSWIPDAEFTSSMESLTSGFPERKLNDFGHIIV